MGEEKEILLRGKVGAYLTGRLMGDPDVNDTSEGPGQLGDRLRGGFVDRIAMAEDGALKREFRELLNTLVRLGHIGRVLEDWDHRACCRCCSWRRRG